MGEWTGGSIAAALLGIWGTFALDVFSTLKSSPETTEVWAKDRQHLLSHWLVIADAVALGATGTASIVSKKPWPALAGIAIVVMMHILYKHATVRGLQAPKDNAGGAIDGLTLGTVCNNGHRRSDDPSLARAHW
jgi:hypothetical protein